ncbi:MAG: hypothetical protein ABR906_00390 [Terracidiphilus sp.]|jgi:hypothetical protein
MNTKSAAEGLEPEMPGLAGIGQPRHGIGRIAVSLARGRPAASRIELALQSIGSWWAGSGWRGQAARVGRKAPLVIL